MVTVKEILETMDYGPGAENPAEVRAWLATHGRFGHFIAGAFTASSAVRAVQNPATGAVLAEVARGSAEDIAAALAAARAAQPGWAALPDQARAEALHALARQLQKRASFLAGLATLDTGTPIRESRDPDLAQAVRAFHHAAGRAALRGMDHPGRVPHAVTGVVLAPALPLMGLATAIAPVLATGGTVVVVPAPEAPLAALAVAEICAETGLPAGVVNIVTGDADTALALAGADLDRLIFAGTTEAGRAARRASAAHGPALSLRLDGSSAVLVFPDADLDAAVEGVVAGWLAGGQLPSAGARLLVAEAVAEPFTARLTARLAKLQVCDPLARGSDIGALLSEAEATRLAALIAATEAEGAVALRPAGPQPETGAFVAPTLLLGTAPATPLNAAPLRGPVATLMTFRTPAEAVELANASRFGAAASVWSENITLATDIAARLHTATVWINSTAIFDAAAPAGARRDSGFGATGFEAALAPLAPRALPEAATGGLDAAPSPGPGTIPGAVEAAQKAAGWAKMSGHGRAQVLRSIAETLSRRHAEIAARLHDAGHDPAEVAATIELAVRAAALADAGAGHLAATGAQMQTLLRAEPLGVIGIASQNAQPLLGLAALVLPAIAAGNRVVAIPAEAFPAAATELAQVFASAGLPAGVATLVSGPRDALASVLAGHDEVAALWYCGTPETAARLCAETAASLKPVWCPVPQDWAAAPIRATLAEAQQHKTIWLPYGA